MASFGQLKLGTATHYRPTLWAEAIETIVGMMNNLQSIDGSGHELTEQIALSQEIAESVFLSFGSNKNQYLQPFRAICKSTKKRKKYICWLYPECGIPEDGHLI